MIQSVERDAEDPEVLLVTMDDGTVTAVPKDAPPDGFRARVQAWLDDGNTITDQPAATRRQRLRQRRKAQVSDEADRLARAAETVEDRKERVERAMLFAAGTVAGSTWNQAALDIANDDYTLGVYLLDVKRAERQAYVALNGLTALADLAAYDPAVDPGWPTPP